MEQTQRLVISIASRDSSRLRIGWAREHPSSFFPPFPFFSAGEGEPPRLQEFFLFPNVLLWGYWVTDSRENKPSPPRRVDNYRVKSGDFRKTRDENFCDGEIFARRVIFPPAAFPKSREILARFFPVRSWFHYEESSDTRPQD